MSLLEAVFGLRADITYFGEFMHVLWLMEKLLIDFKEYPVEPFHWKYVLLW